MFLTCDKCPLDVFLDCLFEQDYKRLIIEGDATEETLINVWQNLYGEYSQLMNADNASDHLDTLKECNVLFAKINLVDAISHCLNCFYDSELVAILEELQLKPGITNEDSEKDIQAKLRKVLTRAKKFIVEYGQKKKELTAIEETNENKKGGRGDYEDMLSILSKEQGYHVKASEITVAYFCRQCEKIKANYQRKLMDQQIAKIK